MRTRTKSLLLTGAAVFLASALPAPRSTGVLPGEFGIPPNPSGSFPACGACHDPNPNANGVVKVEITPQLLSVDAGGTVPVSARVTGGPGLGLGGFCMETSAGRFQAGTNTRTTPAGDAITHLDKFGNSWAFTYTAPNTPGVVRWTAAGQSVNADLAPTGDSFGFYGPNSGQPGVPVRLYVNAPAVGGFGTGCAGLDGHQPVLGASRSATIGASFDTELVSVFPGAFTFCALGDSATAFGTLPLPFDLAILGAPNCLVRCNHLFTQSAAAPGQGSGGGRAVFSWPLPNDPGLRGATLFFQAFVLDPAANSLGLAVSNGLKAQIQ